MFLPFVKRQRSKVLLPEELETSASTPQPVKTEWSAICNDQTRYRWPVGSHRAMGLANLRKWVERITARHGYPVRIRHHERVGSERELVDEMLWSSGSEFDDDFQGAEMLPSTTEQILGADGQTFVEATAETPLERAICLFLEKPQTLQLALATVSEFLVSLRTPDDLAIKAAGEHAAECAAAAVENKLAELMRDAGYDVDEDGEMTSPEESHPAAAQVIDVEEEQELDEEPELEEEEELEQEEEPELEQEAVNVVAFEAQEAS